MSRDELKVGKDIRCGGGGKIRLLTEEAAEVARWFGLGKKARNRKRRGKLLQVRERVGLKLASGTITLITGASGAGKSMLLRRVRQEQERRGRRWIDLDELRCDDAPIVNCFGDQPVRATLELLNRVGLGEAWSYLRTPPELSEGQKFRLRLALGLRRVGMAGDGPVLACDEFAAVLDRLTAMIVARCLRRAIDASSTVAAVVATSHEDLVAALAPDKIVRCDFGRIEYDARG